MLAMAQHVRVVCRQAWGRMCSVCQAVLQSGLHHVVVVQPAVGFHHGRLLLAEMTQNVSNVWNAIMLTGCFSRNGQLFKLLPEYLVCANNDWNLGVFRAVFDLHNCVHPTERKKPIRNKILNVVVVLNLHKRSFFFLQSDEKYG